MSIRAQECSLDNHTITWTVTQCQYSHRNVFCTITPLDTTLDQVDPLVIVLGWGFFPDFYDPPTPTFFLSFGPAITPPPHFFLHNHVKSRYFWPHPHIFSHILHSTHILFCKSQSHKNTAIAGVYTTPKNMKKGIPLCDVIPYPVFSFNGRHINECHRISKFLNLHASTLMVSKTAIF